MDKTVHTAQVDEDTVRCDILDCTFQHLALFELGDDLLLLLLELCLDKRLVRHNHVLELLVDFHNLEFHGLAYEDIVVADRLHIDLRAGEERLHAEHIDNHAALCAALDEALDDFIIFESLIDAFPGAGCTGFLVGEDKLALLVFLVFNEDLNDIANLDVGIVAEFADRDDAVALVADVNHCLTLVERDDGTFDYVLVLYGVE